MADNRIRFTKARVDGLQPPSGKRQGYFYDTASRGLCVYVTAKGIRTFYLLRKFNGRTERVKIGRYPDTTINQARTRAGQINSQFDAGNNSNEIKRQQRGEFTLQDVYDDYMKRHAYVYNRRPDISEANYRLYLSHWANRRLSTISKSEIQRWHAKTGSEIGERTANNALALLRAMFNRAIDWDLFNSANPTQGIRKFKNVVRDRFLFPDELKRFLEALKRSEPVYRDLFLLMLLTGARKTNVVEMRWRDINFDSLIWTIPQTKIGEPQTLPVSGTVIDLLKNRAVRKSAAKTNVVRINTESYSQDAQATQQTVIRYTDPNRQKRKTLKIGSPFVFPGTGKNGFLTNPKKAWERILNAAEITDFRMHDLRRTHGSYMAATGANQFVISRALGHKDIATTAIYARLDLDPIRLAAERAAETMLANVSGLITSEPVKN